MPFEGILYDKNPDSSVECRLCAHFCTIRNGKRGICGVRENRNGTLYSLVYGKLIANHVDPIEKKPLYHFQPGTLSCSIATAGCNMSCKHCQNYQISIQAAQLDPVPGEESTPTEVVTNALKTGCSSISYTYTEPTIFMEFARDCALEAVNHGLSNVFVTNGFMSEESAILAGNFLDAANIDLKGATEDHYRRICGASLQPVLDTIKYLYQAGVWIEVTTLIIPGYNDDAETFEFISSFLVSLDPKIPWHISRFFPTYKMQGVPPTPYETIEKAMRIGEKSGLKYVYPGNMPGMSDITKCSGCGNVLIQRTGFSSKLVHLTGKGTCLKCGKAFEGRMGKPDSGSRVQDPED